MSPHCFVIKQPQRGCHNNSDGKCCLSQPFARRLFQGWKAEVSWLKCLAVASWSYLGGEPRTEQAEISLCLTNRPLARRGGDERRFIQASENPGPHSAVGQDSVLWDETQEKEVGSVWLTPPICVWFGDWTGFYNAEPPGIYCRRKASLFYTLMTQLSVYQNTFKHILSLDCDYYDIWLLKKEKHSSLCRIRIFPDTILLILTSL